MCDFHTRLILNPTRFLIPEVDRIRVFVRIRPQTDEELKRGESLGFETILERNEVGYR